MGMNSYQSRHWHHHRHPRYRQLVYSSLLVLLISIISIHAQSTNTTTSPYRCRSYCGNVTVDYPFAIRPGCGHSGYRDLLFCINGLLLLHLPSGSYRVLAIDYAYQSLTLHDPAMSTCLVLRNASLTPTVTGSGFVLEPWRAAFLQPTADNVFLLLGCTSDSPLFQGFPEKHLPCRNVSDMGCEDFYACPAWAPRRTGRALPGQNDDDGYPTGVAGAYGSPGPSASECCAVPFGAIREVNLSKLGCEGYSSAYSLAPVRAAGGAMDWMYGIRVAYTVPPDHDSFCRDCQATGGACGYDEPTRNELCLCPGWNSSSTCDSELPSTSMKSVPSLAITFLGFWICKLMLFSLTAN